MSPATRILFLANPNNPTGTMIPQSEVERLRAGLPSDVLLVLDAAYAEYVDEPGYDPGIKLVDAGDNTVMTRTFSKVFGLGGARVGWCYGPPSVIDVLNRVRSPFNINIGAQAAAIAALAEPGWVEKGREHNKKYRAWLTDAVRKLGLEVPDSAGNFILAGFGTMPAPLPGAMRRSRRGASSCARSAAYGLGQYLRITVGHGGGVRARGRGAGRVRGATSRDRACLNRCFGG